jgi:hypothetical protein
MVLNDTELVGLKSAETYSKVPELELSVKTNTETCQNSTEARKVDEIQNVYSL